MVRLIGLLGGGWRCIENDEQQVQNSKKWEVVDLEGICSSKLNSFLCIDKAVWVDLTSVKNAF
jgi:hypothetical protein